MADIVVLNTSHVQVHSKVSAALDRRTLGLHLGVYDRTCYRVAVVMCKTLTLSPKYLAGLATHFAVQMHNQWLWLMLDDYMQGGNAYPSACSSSPHTPHASSSESQSNLTCMEDTNEARQLNSQAAQACSHFKGTSTV